MAKKLMINCATCDARNALEENVEVRTINGSSEIRSGDFVTTSKY